MSLEEWRKHVDSHLQFIEAGSKMTARHAAMLPGKPVWESLAENDLAKARAVLETALAEVTSAQAIYAAKPVIEGTSRAA